MSDAALDDALFEQVGAALRGRTFTLIGLSGAQGSGKSTRAAALCGRLRGEGIAAAQLSIDDFYRTRAERQAMAAAIHPLFATRGVPGTHDVTLACEIIDRIESGEAVALPRFDKTVDDRRPVSAWDRADAGTRVLILEGWCVGAPPQDERRLLAPVNQLEAREDTDGVWRSRVNEELSGPYRGLFARIDKLIFLAAPDFDVVETWRSEQERALDPHGGGMDMPTLQRFLDHYERLTRHMLEVMPGRADVTIRLDRDRRMQSIAQARGVARAERRTE